MVENSSRLNEFLFSDFVQIHKETGKFLKGDRKTDGKGNKGGENYPSNPIG